MDQETIDKLKGYRKNLVTELEQYGNYKVDKRFVLSEMAGALDRKYAKIIQNHIDELDALFPQLTE